MKTEEFAQAEAAIGEGLNFDAHEFDGLRDDFAAAAETWLKRVDRFVQDNPWLCIGMAAAAGCTLAYVLRKSALSEARKGAENDEAY